MSYDQGLVIFTARNSSCGKVMFLQVSVCPQRGLYPACNRAGGCVSQHAIGKGVCDQGVRQGGGATRGCVTGGVHPHHYDQQAGGMQSTGMLSCWNILHSCTLHSMGLSVTVIHLQAYFLFTDTDIEMRVFTEVYNLRVEAKISEDVKSLSHFRKIFQ